MEEFIRLYDEAVAIRGKREISSFITAGSVAAALLTENGNIYVDYILDTRKDYGWLFHEN